MMAMRTRTRRPSSATRCDHDRPTARFRSGRVLAILTAFWSVCLDSSAVLWAQSTRPGKTPAGGGITADLLNGWIAETVMMMLAVGAAFALAFLVVFPMLLRKANPWWPLNAYGFCLALAFTLCCVAGLAIFWEDLLLRGSQSAPRSSFDVWALRGGVGAAWALVTTIILSVFRSSKGRAPAR